MKKLLVVIATLGFTLCAQADWTETANSLLGKNDQETTSNAVDYAKGLIPAIKGATDTTNKQAKGGVGSLFEMAQSNLSKEDFSSLAAMVPDLDMDKLLAAAPDVADKTSSLTNMLGASGAADALGSAQTIYDQFKALGLTSEQVAQYVDVTQGYLESEGGQAAVDLFKQGLGALAGP